MVLNWLIARKLFRKSKKKNTKKYPTVGLHLQLLELNVIFVVSFSDSHTFLSFIRQWRTV